MCDWESSIARRNGSSSLSFFSSLRCLIIITINHRTIALRTTINHRTIALRTLLIILHKCNTKMAKFCVLCNKSGHNQSNCRLICTNVGRCKFFTAGRCRFLHPCKYKQNCRNPQQCRFDHAKVNFDECFFPFVERATCYSLTV
jgi:uncharacterized protein YjbI with pentapeptide repeats